MRDLTGKWHVAEIMAFNEKTQDFEWKKIEDFLKKPDLDYEYIHAAKTIIEIDNDKIYMLSPIPAEATQEEIDEAVAAGEFVMRDGMICPETFEWKTENGKAYFDSHTEGEALGEQVSPWVEIEEIGDMIELMTFRFVKE